MSSWKPERICSLPDIVTTKDLIDNGIYRNHYEAYIERQSGNGPRFVRDKHGKIFYFRQDIIDFISGYQSMSEQNQNLRQTNIVILISAMIVSIVSIIFFLIMTSCTLSFQIIDTHGTASDVVDETQSPKNDISPTVQIPVTP